MVGPDCSQCAGMSALDSADPAFPDLGRVERESALYNSRTLWACQHKFIVQFLDDLFSGDCPCCAGIRQSIDSKERLERHECANSSY